MITELPLVVLFTFFRGSNTLCPSFIGQYVSSGTRIDKGCYPNISSCVLSVSVSVLLGFSEFAFTVLALLSFVLGSIFSPSVFTSDCVVLAQTSVFRRRPQARFVLVFPSEHWREICAGRKKSGQASANTAKCLFLSFIRYRITGCLSLNISDSHCHFGSADPLEICLSSIFFPSPEATPSFLLSFAAQSGSFVHWQRFRGYETWPLTTISSQ